MTAGRGGAFPDNSVLISVAKGFIRNSNVWKRWEMNGGLFSAAGVGGEGGGLKTDGGGEEMTDWVSLPLTSSPACHSPPTHLFWWIHFYPTSRI